MKPSSISIFNSGWVNVRRAALGCMAMVVLIESALCFAPEGRFTLTAKQRMSELTELPSPKMQIFGDSVSDSGINERILTEALGLNPGELINYSIPGTTAYCAYSLLKRQISAGRVPKTIILAYNDRSYTLPLVSKFLGRLGSWDDFWDGMTHGVSLENLLSSLTCRTSFTLRYREELNSIIRTGEGLDYFNPQLNRALSRSERYERLPILLPLQAVNKQPRALNPEFHRHPFRFNNETAASLHEFFQLTRQHQIKVLFVSMPKTIEAVALHDENGYNTAYQHFIKHMVEAYGAKWLLGAPTSLPPEDFSDAVHLTPKAAFLFSHQLATRLLMEFPQIPVTSK